ncbi:MAG: hypothetical protein ACRD26_15970 [Vicinamibacterales bacterium]
MRRGAVLGISTRSTAYYRDADTLMDHFWREVDAILKKKKKGVE